MRSRSDQWATSDGGWCALAAPVCVPIAITARCDRAPPICSLDGALCLRPSSAHPCRCEPCGFRLTRRCCNSSRCCRASAFAKCSAMGSSRSGPRCAHAAPQQRGGEGQGCPGLCITAHGHAGLEPGECAAPRCQQQRSASPSRCWYPACWRQARAAGQHLPGLIEEHHVHRARHAEAVNSAGGTQQQPLLLAQVLTVERAMPLPERRDHPHLACQQHPVVNPNRQHANPRSSLIHWYGCTLTPDAAVAATNIRAVQTDIRCQVCNHRCSLLHPSGSAGS
jgi:hypothetical protein